MGAQTACNNVSSGVGWRTCQYAGAAGAQENLHDTLNDRCRLAGANRAVYDKGQTAVGPHRHPHHRLELLPIDALVKQPQAHALLALLVPFPLLAVSRAVLLQVEGREQVLSGEQGKLGRGAHTNSFMHTSQCSSVERESHMVSFVGFGEEPILVLQSLQPLAPFVVAISEANEDATLQLVNPIHVTNELHWLDARFQCRRVLCRAYTDQVAIEHRRPLFHQPRHLDGIQLLSQTTLVAAIAERVDCRIEKVICLDVGIHLRLLHEQQSRPEANIVFTRKLSRLLSDLVWLDCAEGVGKSKLVWRH
mmetsp:Transcript_34853/g.56424  ORF Transcript_34853/g.56424 Transcript_34853/m.56424 type:complete len:306 (-) Transcript_34853:1449-2366(-)